MKSKHIIILLLCIISSVGCEKHAVSTQQPTASFEQCYEPPKGTGTYKLCLDSILSDSRCPANVTCIWQGVAVAKFRFTANSQTDTFILSTLDFPPYSADTVLQGYKIRLINLYPYPGDGNTQIKAEVSVTQ